jgi:hypothetical protein
VDRRFTRVHGGPEQRDTGAAAVQQRLQLAGEGGRGEETKVRLAQGSPKLGHQRRGGAMAMEETRERGKKWGRCGDRQGATRPI